jgi:hypothetical protein
VAIFLHPTASTQLAIIEEVSDGYLVFWLSLSHDILQVMLMKGGGRSSEMRKIFKDFFNQKIVFFATQPTEPK